MVFRRLIKYKFIFDFLQLRKIYPFYSGVLNTTNGQLLKSEVEEDGHRINNRISVVNYIPPFLKPHIGDTAANTSYITPFKIAGSLGFMVDLKGYHDIDGYIKEKMGRKSRNIKRSIRRLETCFDIEYKFYFGQISKETYDFLFLKLRSLLDRRFKQKGVKHELFDSWDFLVQTTYEMILGKEASFFVIYENKKPIAICLSYHYQNIYHNAIGAYDIDYAKFSLGQIDIYKQIEWCLENNFQLFDLGPGNTAHKRLWCNVIYDFEHQVICSKHNIQSKVTALSIKYYYKAKAFLKQRNLDKVYHLIRKSFDKKKQEGSRYIDLRFETLPEQAYPKRPVLTHLSLGEASHAFLKKPVCDFQYSYLETLKEIKLYKLEQEENVYLIQGTNHRQYFRIVDQTDLK